MSWSRVKWLLIGILLVGNLTMAFLFLSRRNESSRADEQLLVTLKNALAERGVSLASDVEAQLLIGKSRLYSLRDTDREAALATALFGAVTRTDRGGRIHRYEAAAGWALFLDSGQFQVEWTTPRRASGPIEQDATALLQSLGFPVDPSPIVLSTESVTTIAVTQIVDGNQVLDAGVLLRYEGDAAVSLSGRWVWGDPLPAEGEASCPVFGAVMLRFVDSQSDSGHSIVSVVRAEEAWALSLYRAEYVCLSPVWRIEIQDRSLTIDAKTGDIMEMEQ